MFEMLYILIHKYKGRRNKARARRPAAAHRSVNVARVGADMVSDGRLGREVFVQALGAVVLGRYKFRYIRRRPAETMLAASALLCAQTFEHVEDAINSPGFAAKMTAQIGTEGAQQGINDPAWSKAVMLVTAARDLDPGLVDQLVESDRSVDMAVLMHHYILVELALSSAAEITGQSVSAAFQAVVDTLR